MSAAVATPRVLVLLASWNGAAWIEEQVRSILEQSGVDVRVVVGDDASSDDTVQRLQARWACDPRLAVICWPQASGSAGANFQRLFRHANLAGVDFVALADQDDAWLEGKLRAATAAIAAQGAAGYSAAVQAYWADGREAVLSQCARTRRADFLFEGAGQGCTFVMTTAFFARVQAFLRVQEEAVPVMHFHDWLLYLLSRAWGERWVFDATPRMRYRQHASNEIGARGGAGAIGKRIRMIRDGWYRTQVLKAAAVYVLAGGAEPAVLRLRDALVRGRGRGLLESAVFAARLLRDGRRRLSDRGVLAVAALMRWI